MVEPFQDFAAPGFKKQTLNRDLFLIPFFPVQKQLFPMTSLNAWVPDILLAMDLRTMTVSCVASCQP